MVLEGQRQALCVATPQHHDYPSLTVSDDLIGMIHIVNQCPIRLLLKTQSQTLVEADGDCLLSDLGALTG